MFSKLAEFTITESINVDASARNVWKIVKDVDHYDRYLSFIESSERCDGSTPPDHPIKVGTRLRRRLVMAEGKEFDSEITISAIDDDKMYLAFYSEDIAGGITARVSWTIIPVLGEAGRELSSSRIVECAAYLPKGLFTCIAGKILLCFCCVKGTAQKMIIRNLQDFAKAAETEQKKDDQRG